MVHNYASLKFTCYQDSIWEENDMHRYAWTFVTLQKYNNTSFLQMISVVGT